MYSKYQNTQFECTEIQGHFIQKFAQICSKVKYRSTWELNKTNTWEVQDKILLGRFSFSLNFPVTLKTHLLTVNNFLNTET